MSAADEAPRIAALSDDDFCVEARALAARFRLSGYYLMTAAMLESAANRIETSNEALVSMTSGATSAIARAEAAEEARAEQERYLREAEAMRDTLVVAMHALVQVQWAIDDALPLTDSPTADQAHGLLRARNAARAATDTIIALKGGAA